MRICTMCGERTSIWTTDLDTGRCWACQKLPPPPRSFIAMEEQPPESIGGCRMIIGRIIVVALIIFAPIGVCLRLYSEYVRFIQPIVENNKKLLQDQEKREKDREEMNKKFWEDQEKKFHKEIER